MRDKAPQASRSLQVFLFLAFTGIAASATHAQGHLTSNPTAANFGNVEIGSSKTIQVIIKNTGSTTAVVTRENLNGDMYTVSGIKPPMSIAPGAKVVMSIKFEPSKAGPEPGSVIIGSGKGFFPTALLVYSLSGTGVAAATLDATPINVSFGSVLVGTSISKSVQLENYGTKGAIIASASVSGAGFSTTGLTTPMTLAAGGTKSFTLKFTPTGTGTDSGTITLKTTFGSKGLTLNMSGTGIKPTGAGSPPPSGTGSPRSTGTGVPAVAHSVALSWDASTSPEVVGYNVYRATSPSTTYAKLANSLVLNYADETVQAGTTYTYVVTAVNSTGEESVHSGSVTAVIP